MNAAVPPVPASAAAMIAAVVRPEIRALSAYAVAKPGALIKLDANESPYPLPPALQAAIAAAVAAVPVNRYPDAGADRLVAALSASLALPEGAGVILGNGSDELIAMLTTLVAQPGAAMLVPEPTFVMYRMNALYNGMRCVGVPLRADLTLDADAMQAAVERERPAVTFLASPNNPTGNRFAAGDVERILRAAPGLVVVDEAYCAFADGTFLPRLSEFGNLVVLRTFSKIGMAALRLGYAVAAKEWIAELNKVRQPYNINALTQAAAEAVLAAPEVVGNHVAAIRAERGRLLQALSAGQGLHVFPTEANFVLVRVPDGPRWFRELRDAGILVKSFHGAHPLLVHCLRITVGTPDENDALIAALGKIA